MGKGNSKLKESAQLQEEANEEDLSQIFLKKERSRSISITVEKPIRRLSERLSAAPAEDEPAEPLNEPEPVILLETPLQEEPIEPAEADGRHHMPNEDQHCAGGCDRQYHRSYGGGYHHYDHDPSCGYNDTTASKLNDNYCQKCEDDGKMHGVVADDEQSEVSPPQPEGAPKRSASDPRSGRELWKLAVSRIRSIGVIAAELRQIRSKNVQQKAEQSPFEDLTMAQLVHQCRQAGVIRKEGVFVALARQELVQLLSAYQRGEALPPAEAQPLRGAPQVLKRTLTVSGQDTNSLLLQLSCTIDTTTLSRNPHDAALLEQPDRRLERQNASIEQVRLNANAPIIQGAARRSLRRAASAPPLQSPAPKPAAAAGEGEQESASWELQTSELQTRLEHMLFEVPLLCGTDDIEGVVAGKLMEVYEENLELFTEEVLDMWRGWQDAKIFGSVSAVKDKLQTIVAYGEERASDDIKKRLRCITFLVVNQPKDYDAVSIMLCLAQNGGVCDVQKEVGVRMVYAQMTGQQGEDNAATSLEGSLAQLLQATRESLTEKVAISIIDTKGLSSWGEGIYNTHDLFPIRNSMCEVIGLPRIPDPNSTDKPMDRSWVRMFLDEYSTEYITEIVLQGMNDRDNRKIQYEPAMEWFTNNAPEGWDPYDFAEQVVFDMDTGDFTKAAVTYMLMKESIFNRTRPTREEDIDEYLNKYQSEAEKAAEEEKKKKEAAEAEAAEQRRIQEEIIQKEREEAEAKRLADEEHYKARQAELKNTLTDEDLAIVEDLKNFGFSEEAIIQCYLACEKDRDMAVNLLLEM